MSGAESLEIVLADAREMAAMVRRSRDERTAGLIDDLCDRISAAAEDYLRFLPESDAVIHSGRSEKWLRAQFAELERQGHARRERGINYFRMLILPRKANLAGAREAGRKAAQRVRDGEAA